MKTDSNVYVWESLKSDGICRMYEKIRLNLNKAIVEEITYSLSYTIYNRFLDEIDSGTIQYFTKCRLHQYEESKPV